MHECVVALSGVVGNRGSGGGMVMGNGWGGGVVMVIRCGSGRSVGSGFVVVGLMVGSGRAMKVVLRGRRVHLDFPVR